MSESSSPIDIASPTLRYGSNSPHNHTSNLTSALQRAGVAASPLPSSNPRQNTRQNTADGKSSSARPEALAVPHGARAISVADKGRRESALGSFRGGMSWGAMSVGSYLQDDIMMGGLSPSMNSPSFHSSSYLPKMEANFWNNLKCCDMNFSNLHELVSHFEEVHKPTGTNFPAGSMNGGLPRRKSSTTNPADWRAQTQVRGFQPTASNGAPRFAQQFVRKPSTFAMQDMDTIGEMELDDDPAMSGQNFESFEQQHNPYSNDSTPQLQQAFPNADDQSRFESSRSSSPPSAHQQTTFGTDLFAGLNASAYGTQPQQQQTRPQPQQPQSFNGAQNFSQIESQDSGFDAQFNSNAVPFNSQMLQRLDTEFGNMTFGRNSDMVELCINEPAKNLYSADGGFNSQQYPHFNFGNNNDNSVTNNSDENAQKLQAHRLATGLGKQPTEEERPFKCPVIGCEKAYKNANGLRYHEKHGHSSQKLKDNGDGSFSIVDPVTSIPYPGTVGMEKEKPYRCEVCGKRYKNLNGLKYHRNHSPPCNPDYSMSNIPSMESTVDAEAVY